MSKILRYMKRHHVVVVAFGAIVIVAALIAERPKNGAEASSDGHGGMAGM